MPGLMSGIYGFLGLEEFPSNKDSKDERQRSSETDPSGVINRYHDGTDTAISSSHRQPSNIQVSDESDVSTANNGTDKEEEFEGFMDAKSVPDHSDADVDIAQFEHRLASSSASDADSDSEVNGMSRTRFLHTNGRPQSKDDLSISPSPTPTTSRGGVYGEEDRF
jgi:hypothetical protein